MGKIGIHNYEAYLLDYLEGRTGQADLAALKLFAVLHPELEIDLEQDALPVFEPEDLIFDWKDNLRKTEQESVEEEVFNYLENELSKEKREVFDAKLLTNKLLHLELDRYKKTILLPDPNIVYQAKQQLKKQGAVIPLFHLRNKTAMAAALLLLFTLSLVLSYYFKRDENLKPEWAKKELLIHKRDYKNLTEQAKKQVALVSVPVPANSKTKWIVGLSRPNKITAKTQIIKSDSSILNPLTEKNQSSTSNPDQEIIQGTDVYEALTIVKQNTENQSLINKDSAMLQTGTKQYLLTVDDEELPAIELQTKHGFWKRAVKLARRANSLGIKAVDGGEENRKYSLSFNAFSVEKR